MSKINKFEFSLNGVELLKKEYYGLNWPVVYLIENGKDAYIGQTTRALGRSLEHIKNPKRKVFIDKNFYIINDDEYNMSAIYDIESFLIQYISADQKYNLQNGNKGLKDHNYFDREKYKAKFETIWDKLKEEKIVQNDLIQLKNSDIFKYSPFKALSNDQLETADSLYENIKNINLENNNQSYIVNGGPGTGKTILAIYLIKFLLEQDEIKNMNIALVIPMTSLRNTLKKVFRNIKSGLKSSMVIGPSDVVKKDYDLLIVDESHRLRKPKNISFLGEFYKKNKLLGLGKDSTELDWILKSSKQQIFFYDINQSVRPSDVDSKDFKNINAINYKLTNQIRVEGGDEYIKLINDLLDNNINGNYKINNYDYQILDNLLDLVNKIKSKNETEGLSRLVAGYAWDWKSQKNKDDFDIIHDELKLKWNSETKDWINSKNAINEVGCIHTVQGYDLNYTGVIIGPEISYDINKKKIIIKKENYKDKKGFYGISDEKELERYIINIYKTLLTRGIKGTYVYIFDENLREYFKNNLFIKN